VVGGRDVWGQEPKANNSAPFRGRLTAHDFEWEGDRPLGLPFENLVIYEMHVRGFTRDPSSQVKNPGTYAAIREKIPYLKELGVNAVELLPIFEFDECDSGRSNPVTGERLWNYWGYSTVGFWAPKAGYAATGAFGMQVDEFKTLVKELHKAGIEVILDVVFNHTAEGNENGPTLSFRGIDNRTYYMLSPEGSYMNFSGCGNTLNCNNPSVRDFVLQCLRYWVAEFHIDGFRFDLASILGRDPFGGPMANPPLVEALALDPVLGKTKLIAEAWDAGGLYQVGSFPSYGRWAEWNGKYRDCVRKFLKGDMGQVSEVSRRLLGSPTLYAGRGATASINFITCHDGFTLMDLVSYNGKHNEANGEDNRDGANDNESWNCGAEGATDDANIIALRRRQIKNALAILLVSQGVPMLLMGDEVGKSQNGNNNTYCHDSPLNWFDWSLREKNADILTFCRGMIAFRHRHSALRFAEHAGTTARDGGTLDASFHGVTPWNADWDGSSRTIAVMLRYRRENVEDVVYAAFNMHWETLSFGLPDPPTGTAWHVAVNTAASPGNDVWAEGNGPKVEDQRYVLVTGRSVMVLEARPA
jgi:glycogen operon protein